MWAVDNWYQCLISGMIIWYEKSVARARVCAITQLKGVILIGESLLYHLAKFLCRSWTEI